MNVEVREVLPSEFDAVAELTARVYADQGWSRAAYAVSLRDVAGRVAGATVLVAVEDGALLGAVTVATRGGPWAERAGAGEAELRMLAVAAPARGRGIGELLTRACLDRARSDGCVLVRLSSQPDMHAAHRLYARLGFVRTPEDDWQPVPEVPLLAFGLPLVPWCDQCGTVLEAVGHRRCRAARDLEPPRYCPQCRRRMVVQVLPGGWTARCVEHGTTTV